MCCGLQFCDIFLVSVPWLCWRHSESCRIGEEIIRGQDLRLSADVVDDMAVQMLEVSAISLVLLSDTTQVPCAEQQQDLIYNRCGTAIRLYNLTESCSANNFWFVACRLQYK